MTELNEWVKCYFQPESVRQRYPKGTVIRLYSMDKEPDMPEGLTGTVTMVDDIGQIHMVWENGSTLALMEGVDCFQAISRPTKKRNEPSR